MTQSSVATAAKSAVRFIGDACIVIVFVAGVGYGGYYLGTHEAAAPIEHVPTGTPGAISQQLVERSMRVKAPEKPTTTATAAGTATGTGTGTAAGTAAGTPPKAPLKFWLSSSGDDFIGSSITVKINGDPVDNFFGPGKNVDITRLVKTGNNDIEFESKALGDQYNKHTGDDKASLKVDLVSGPLVQESYKPADVVTSYKRSATDTEDDTDVEHFTAP